jgi:hypothetical protein
MRTRNAESTHARTPLARRVPHDAEHRRRSRFLRGYSGLNRSIRGLDGAPEWPALRASLPNLCGPSVLDLGCG